MTVMSSMNETALAPGTGGLALSRNLWRYILLKAFAPSYERMCNPLRNPVLL